MKSLNTFAHYYGAQLLECNIMGHFLSHSSMVALATWFVEILPFSSFDRYHLSMGCTPRGAT